VGILNNSFKFTNGALKGVIPCCEKSVCTLDINDIRGTLNGYQEKMDQFSIKYLLIYLKDIYLSFLRYIFIDNI